MKLGIDQSMSCSGCVVFDDDDKMIHFDTIKTSKTDGSIFLRFNMITDIILNIIKEYDIDIVNIEGLAFGPARGNSSRDLAGLQAVIISRVLSEYDIECNIWAPTAIKKFATGNGKASKVEMVASLPEDVLQKFKDTNYKKTTGIHDLTDAYYIGVYN